MTKNRQISNPFQFGVVVDDSAFCNRIEEIEFLKTQINNSYSTWLFSPRRFGKTSLVEKVFRETDDVVCIYLDLYNISSVDDFCRKYSKVLAEKLFNWRMNMRELSHKLADSFKRLSPSVAFDESGNPSFSLNLSKIDKQEDIETILEVPNIIAREKDVKICIAFDEFQEISRIDKFMLHWMRSSFQRHRSIAYVFLGSKQSLMEEIFTLPSSPFYEFAVKMNLSRIERPELFAFIRANFRKHSISIEEDTINLILDKSECQPHFTQYFASVVFDLLKAGADQDQTDFCDLWMNRIIYSQADVFQDIYDQLTSSQRTVIQGIARLKDLGIFSEEAKQKYKLPSNSTINEALKSLQKKGLLYSSDRSYRITNPVFREWLLRLP